MSPMKKILNKILLQYFGTIDIEIKITEISNGYLVNNKYVPTRDAVQAEVIEIIKDPSILIQSK